MESIYNPITTGQTPLAKKDHVMPPKVPEQQLMDIAERLFCQSEFNFLSHVIKGLWVIKWQSQINSHKDTWADA